MLLIITKKYNKIMNELQITNVNNLAEFKKHSTINIAEYPTVKTFKISDPIGEITFLNPVPGEEYKLIIKSNEKYKFAENILWPSNIQPVPSEKGRIDLFSFIADNEGNMLGTFAFNYILNKQERYKILNANTTAN